MTWSICFVALGFKGSLKSKHAYGDAHIVSGRDGPAPWWRHLNYLSLSRLRVELYKRSVLGKKSSIYARDLICRHVYMSNSILNMCNIHLNAFFYFALFIWLRSDTRQTRIDVILPICEDSTSEESFACQPTLSQKATVTHQRESITKKCV